MKIKIFFMTAFLVLSFQSCSNWLDVTPKDTIAEDDLFKVATGYRNALNGVYKQISSNSLYGRELSWGMVDVLGQCYDSYGLYAFHPYSKLSSYKYTDKNTKPYFESVWTTAYNAIANCNNIIGRIHNEENAKFKGGELEKNLIQGEAIALRGFLHFDLLRLYGAAPIVESTEKYIPYYDKYPSLGEPKKGVVEILNKVITDLKEAQSLVAQYDTTSVQNKELLRSRYRFSTDGFSSSAPVDLFYTHRGYRMNYYAITAMLARVYNYAGQHSLAAEEAQEVIDATFSSYPLFTFTPFENSKIDRKLTGDLIFTLSNPKLYDDYRSFYVGTESVTSTPLLLYTDYGDLFDDKADCRLNLMDKVGYMDVTSNKNVAPPSKSNDQTLNESLDQIADMLPIIRMSEMHLIIAENHANKSDFVAAANAIDIVRAGRNCTKGELSITDFKSFRTNLIKEVNREFFGEGQLFFYYKKFNVKPSSSMKDLKLFIIPIPESEEIN